MINFHIITIFPSMFDSYLHESILARAIENKKISVNFYDPRDYTKDKHNRVDDEPYGGGPGMVMQAEPILRAVDHAKGKKKDVKIVITSAGGTEFTNTVAKQYSGEYRHLIIICGRYEGIDSRVKEVLGAEEVSIGDYVLTGGELPALIMMDAVSRHIKGVLGKEASIEENRTASREMYTRPSSITWKGETYEVPTVLRSGDHKKIEEWRKHNEF